MSYKDLFSKAGLVLIIFFLFLIVLDARGIDPATLNFVDPATLDSPITTNSLSLQILWTDLAPVVLLSGFVLFAALLGANLQFTPISEWFRLKFIEKKGDVD